MNKTLPIKMNYEFKIIYKKGSFYVGRYITLYVLANKKGINRLGITVSKKYGKSVKRNRIRRLVKENYRLFEEYLHSGYDFIFVARNSDLMPTFLEVRKEMKFLFRKLKVFDQEKWECSKSF